MPEEQTATSEAAPVKVEPTPVTSAPQPVAAKPKQKSKGCAIAIIVVVILFVLAIIAVIFAYRYVKSKVNAAKDSASISIGDTKGSASTSGDTYATVTEQKPTDSFVQQINNEVKPALAKVYGDVKLSYWTSVQSESGSLSYVTKNKVTADSYAQVETAVTALGYTKASNYGSTDGSMIDFTKGTTRMTIIMSSDEKTPIVISAYVEKAVDTSSSDTSATGN